jgi:hypothetical protein
MTRWWRRPVARVPTSGGIGERTDQLLAPFGGVAESTAGLDVQEGPALGRRSTALDIGLPFQWTADFRPGPADLQTAAGEEVSRLPNPGTWGGGAGGDDDIRPVQAPVVEAMELDRGKAPTTEQLTERMEDAVLPVCHVSGIPGTGMPVGPGHHQDRSGNPAEEVHAEPVGSDIGTRMRDLDRQTRRGGEIDEDTAPATLGVLRFLHLDEGTPGRDVGSAAHGTALAGELLTGRFDPPVEHVAQALGEGFPLGWAGNAVAGVPRLGLDECLNTFPQVDLCGRAFTQALCGCHHHDREQDEGERSHDTLDSDPWHLLHRHIRLSPCRSVRWQIGMCPVSHASVTGYLFQIPGSAPVRIVLASTT